MDGSDRPTVRTERRDLASRAQLLCRVRAEFHEMPCLRVTVPQAERLFGLRPDICRRVLATLVADGTLYCGTDARYTVRDSSAVRPPEE